MDQRVAHYDEKMKKAYEFLVADLATVRAGRANPHVLDKIKVDSDVGVGTTVTMIKKIDTYDGI